MTPIYVVNVNHSNLGIRSELSFASQSSCRRYMAEYAGRLQFLRRYRVLGVTRLGDALVGITLSDGTDRVELSFSREA